MHVFHVVSAWLGYAGLLAALLGGAIKALWPGEGDRR
jgi:hypothetical protein